MTFVRSARRYLHHSAIRVSLGAIALSRAGSLFPTVGGRGVIFTLHHVRPEVAGDGLSPNANLSVTPQFLQEAVEAALECGLTPVHVHDLPALLADPADTRKFVAFSLDDGYRNNAEFAAPIFRKFGVPYTIYINPGFVERTRTMWWETADALSVSSPSFLFDFGHGEVAVASATTEQRFAALERLASFVMSTDEDKAVAQIDRVANARGIDPVGIVDALVMNEAELRALASDPLVHFGAHTVNHINLRRATPERLRQEILESVTRVENYVGHLPRSFAYPYGWRSAAGEREARAVADAGLLAAVTTQPGVLGPSCIEMPTFMPRVSLNGNYQNKRYVKALITGLPFHFIGFHRILSQHPVAQSSTAA